MPRKAKFYRLRNGRARGSGRIYLITITCHGRQAHFATLQSGRCFVQALRATRAHAVTLGYVVMPDHIHWLLVLREHADLATTVQKAKSVATSAGAGRAGVATSDSGTSAFTSAPCAGRTTSPQWRATSWPTPSAPVLLISSAIIPTGIAPGPRKT